MNDIKTGEKIKQLRLEKHLSQRELASICGISYSNLNKIENDKAEPSIETLLKLSKALGSGLIGASLADFSNNEDNMMLMLLEHVAKYYIPEEIDLKSVLENNLDFYNDTKGLVIDVIKNRFNYYINEKPKPGNYKDMSLSKFFYK